MSTQRPNQQLWSFVATVFLTGLLAASQSLGLTRMNIPYLLGSVVTPKRDRAKAIGFGLHFLNGWLFSRLYQAAFNSWGSSGWWRGAAIGLVHGLFVLVGPIPLLPAIHRSMADEQFGPTPTRQLEPPGFLALHYGSRTPWSIIFAHVVYGTILGHFFRPRTR